MSKKYIGFVYKYVLRLTVVKITNLGFTMMSLEKFNSLIVHKHFNQSCPWDSCTAPMLVLGLYSIVRQLMTTLFRQNISAGTLKVKHFAIESIIMWITAHGAGAFLHRLAGELKGTWAADLGKGAGLTETLQPCWGAGALLCAGSVTPEWVSKLHRFTLTEIKRNVHFRASINLHGHYCIANEHCTHNYITIWIISFIMLKVRQF